MERFLSILHNLNFSPLGEDKLLLKGVKDNGFSVKIMYKGLDHSPAIEFLYCSVWNSIVPPKIGFFAWEASSRKVLTLDQLKRRGRALANRCFLCEEDEETIEHLLIHCSKARMLRDLFLLIVGSSWVFPHLVLHTLLAW